MAKNKKVVFVPRTVIPQTPTFMRKGSRKRSILTLCTDNVFGGTRTTGYSPDDITELERIIEQAMDPDLRLALINLALPPVSHVFMIMKMENELRIYDVQNHYAAGGEVPTWYDDFESEYDCNGYRYFINGLLQRMQMTRAQLRFMPSPELSVETWEIIDYCAENPGKRPSPDEVRGACLLWCDAVLNRHWVALLDEAFP